MTDIYKIPGVYQHTSGIFYDVVSGDFNLALDSSEKVRHIDLLVDHGTEL